MAPILSASVGITRLIVDDERLRTLRSSLEDMKIKGPLDLSFESSEEVTVPLDIEQLVSVVEPWTSWPFEEQVGKLRHDKMSLLEPWGYLLTTNIISFFMVAGGLA